MKSCRRCLRELPTSEFEPRKDSADGLRAMCRDCQYDPKKRDRAHRFWMLVDKSAGENACWPWRGRLNMHGYGRTSFGERAHRVAYELTHQAPPPDKLVCHRCDNPPCVNPAHLFLGTHAENSADMRAKGRSQKPTRQPPRGCRRRRRLAPELCALLRQRHAAGERIADLARAFGLEFQRVHRVVRYEPRSRR
jgi:hypothetical protein